MGIGTICVIVGDQGRIMPAEPDRPVVWIRLEDDSYDLNTSFGAAYGHLLPPHHAQEQPLKTTLVIFSGLPGTGKSTLATLAAKKLQVPLLAIDDVVSSIPSHMQRGADLFWDDMIAILLNLVSCQLSLGLTVVVDSVFMGDDRIQAFHLAKRHHAVFRPIHTFISDEQIWAERVRIRKTSAPLNIRAEVADWQRIKEQRQYFQPWQRDTALWIDGINTIDHNLVTILDFIMAPHVMLRPLVDEID